MQVVDNTLDYDGSKLLAEYGLPIEPMDGDIRLEALRASAWTEGEVNRLVLDGWVHIQVGNFKFDCEKAVIWVYSHQPNNSNLIANEIVLFLDDMSTSMQPSGISASGRELLVTAVTWGEVILASDVLNAGRPDNQVLLRRANERFDNWVRKNTTSYTGPVVSPTTEKKELPIIVKDKTGTEGQTGKSKPKGVVVDRTMVSHGQEVPLYNDLEIDERFKIKPYKPQAILMLQFEEFEYGLSEDGTEGYLTLFGDQVVQYLEYQPRTGESQARHLTLKADRTVLFTDPIDRNQIAMRQVDIDSVRGIYLEGDVIASDGSYTLRGPRMYYEFHSNRAIVLDAVMYMYSQESRVPIYMRASEIRQLAENEWKGTDVRISTSEFFVPTVSLGATSVKLKKSEDKNQNTHHHVDARNTTIRVGDFPIFWWPGYKGPAQETPLRQFDVGGNERNGIIVSTRWNLLALMGKAQNYPNGKLDADLILEHMTERGTGIGLDFDYRLDLLSAKGNFFGYVIQDNGTDLLSSGLERKVNDETRGMIDWWHRQSLPHDWTLIIQASHISDPAFLDSYFEPWAEAGREFQSRIYAKKQRDNWALEIFGKYDFNDFVANEDLLQAQTYSVEKLPEIGYYRYADSLFGGKISYSSEYRVSRMRLSLPQHKLEVLGQGWNGFGIDPSIDLNQALASIGYHEDFVNRFYTRHEVAAPMQWGAFNVVPFIVGRFTSYDNNFEDYNRSAEDMQWFGAGGVRIATSISKVDDTVENRFLDLHRIRHIMEPSITLWNGDSNTDSTDYPLYDTDVEGASIGSAVRLALRNTWQSYRGGPGRWHSVDVLSIGSELVLHGSETQGDYRIPHWYNYRPEYSRFGDHASGDFTWLVSDSFAFAGDIIYDLNDSVIARSNIGYRIDHSQNLFSYADLRYFDAGNQTLLGAGLGYKLTSLYSMQGSITFDIDKNEARYLQATLTRKDQQMDINFGLNYDQIREETTFLLTFAPRGTGGRNYGGIINPPDNQRRR